MRPKAILVSLSFVVCTSLALGATSYPNQGQVKAQSVGHPVLASLSVSSTTTPTTSVPDLNVALAKFIWDRAEAENAWNAALAAKAVKSRRASRRTSSEARYGTGACGGDLPSCSVMMCESHGNLSAENPHSTASGKWQILDSTWDGYDGYSHASDAPEETQDAKAREIYNGGSGRGAWVC